jgi:hypothetical protein
MILNNPPVLVQIPHGIADVEQNIMNILEEDELFTNVIMLKI